MFYAGSSQTWDDGDKLAHGQQGEVVGPATLETHRGKGVAVLFSGNKDVLECYLEQVSRLQSGTPRCTSDTPRAYSWWLRAQVSRDPPPPLPGGYKPGEKVFYTGRSKTFASGNKLVHGQQGEVTGPATGESHKGNGVAVLFPGNKGNVECDLTSVRRLRAARGCEVPPARPPACAGAGPGRPMYPHPSRLLGTARR